MNQDVFTLRLPNLLENIRCNHSIVVDSRDTSNLCDTTCDTRWSEYTIRGVECLRKWHAGIFEIRRCIFESTDRLIARQTVDRLIHVENGFTQAEHLCDVLNRSSVKLAEMDALVRILPDSYVNFVDLCSAPGGFLDYLLLRKRWSATGLGITMSEAMGGLSLQYHRLRRAANDMFVYHCDVRKLALKLDERPPRDRRFRRRREDINNNRADGASLTSENSVTEKFATSTTPDRIEGETCLAHLNAQRRKVNLVLADGAICATNIQTSTNNRELVDAQWRVAKYVLRRGGNFLLKTFAWYDDEDNSKTLDVIRSIVVHFRSFVILKPWHSRITNDERYIFFRSFTSTVRAYDLVTDELTLICSEMRIVVRQYNAYRRIFAAAVSSAETDEQQRTIEHERPIEMHFTPKEMRELTTNNDTFRMCVKQASETMGRYARNQLHLPLMSHLT